jgi:hypothetical protein
MSAEHTAMQLVDRVEGHHGSLSKSTVKRWLEKVAGPTSGMKAIVHHGTHGIRQVGEGAAVGAVLAFVQVQSRDGLDIRTGQYEVPVDLAAAGLGLAGSVAMAHEEYATDLRNMAAGAASIYAFRKVKDVLEKKRALTAHGEESEESDPIVVHARTIQSDV